MGFQLREYKYMEYQKFIGLAGRDNIRCFVDGDKYWICVCDFMKAFGYKFNRRSGLFFRMCKGSTLIKRKGLYFTDFAGFKHAISILSKARKYRDLLKLKRPSPLYLPIEAYHILTLRTSRASRHVFCMGAWMFSIGMALAIEALKSKKV